MIRSFKCKETEKIYKGQVSKKIPYEIQKTSLRKLIMLNASKTVEDLKAPPSNCLEDLQGDRKGQKSIRINIKYRICFVWEDGDTFDVEIIDYHK
jgi:toxin HigB-1